MKVWLAAFRLRTLPLSLSCIFMGSVLAYTSEVFSWSIFLLSVLTTVLLQILSNLANDYGDSVHGADHEGRKGPSRAVQSGDITRGAMKKAVYLFAILALVAGLSLLLVAFYEDILLLIIFLTIGLLSIWAAITYTSGNNPYGYKGLGDISVFLFFGLVGVGGTYFLQIKTVEWQILLPSISCGLFATGVLNVNNIRDIESDRVAGKHSIPVRIGRKKAVLYHWFLLAAGFFCSLFYVLLNYSDWTQFVFMATVPLLISNAKAVAQKKEAEMLDPHLKQLAMTTLLFVLLFGIGHILSA